MIRIQTLRIAGLEEAIHAMRNPYDSWAMSDSMANESAGWALGEKDRELSRKLFSAGSEHCKHLRLIDVWADITAPRYWWTEADTYRAGVDKLSCSTMHTITKREFTEDDFADGDVILESGVLDLLNTWRIQYLAARQRGDSAGMQYWWRRIIVLLPQSYLQMRTMKMSYQALSAMYAQRKHHRLVEWHDFCDWVETLPYSELILHPEQGPEHE